MAATSLDPAVAAATRAALEPLIDRPKLTDKLLSKPPFRFLHDVVTHVTSNTGFLEGVFQGDELNAKALDKHRKVAYLQKLIDAVRAALGDAEAAAITARPSKIVAGHEAEKTNTLLQVSTIFFLAV